MSEGMARKVTPDAVWAEVRKASEGGETARVVAKRYDVGVPALWKRREAEGWKRPETRFGPVEPAEGWEAWAEAQSQKFDRRIADERALAGDLAKAMQGGPMEEAPLWHLGFLYAFRARHLGPEVAAQDRARAMERHQPWVRAFWDADGQLQSEGALDLAIIQLYRDTWREEIGLPDGAAPFMPCPPPRVSAPVAAALGLEVWDDGT